MDTGSSTCFLGDVVDVGYGASKGPSGTVMTAAYFRANMPPAWREEYEALLEAAQRFAAERSRDIKPVYSAPPPAPSGRAAAPRPPHPDAGSGRCKRRSRAPG